MDNDAEDLERVVRLARHTLDAAEPPADHERAQLERLVLRMQTAARAGQRPSFWTRARRPVMALAAVSAAIVLLVGGASVYQQRTSLSYVVQPGSSGATGDRAQPERSEQYLFSDGSSVSVPPDAALTIESARVKRPRVRVVRGSTRVRIVHREESAWTFTAGPFEVLVTGTKFALAWEPEAQQFRLQLAEGSVVLRGPHVDGAMPVRPGQRVTVSLLTGRMVVGNDSDQAGFKGAPEKTSSSPPAVPEADPARADEVVPDAGTPRPPSPGAPARASLSWRALVNRGQFREVIAAARARPLKSCIASCSAEELRALGDAARYSNQTAVAEAAFRSLRQRFAGTGDATVAAFLLGRTYESRKQWSDAIEWYGLYLKEAPDGELAVEASSGKARVTAIGAERREGGQAHRP